MAGLLLDHEWLLHFGLIRAFGDCKMCGYLGFGRLNFLLLLLRILLLLLIT